MTDVLEHPPGVGEKADLGTVWASTRVIPDLRTKNGSPCFGVFFTSRSTYSLVHQFMFSAEATRAAVAVQWDHALGKLGVRPATMVGALAMLEHDHAHRYRKGGHMRFYGQACRVLSVGLANTFVVLHVEHPRAGTLRLVVDTHDNVLEWAAAELQLEACA
mgnify:CR=1 FL=1